MEIQYSLEELSHLTLLSSEQLTEKLTNEETGEQLSPDELKTTLKSLFSEKYTKIQNDSIGRGTRNALQGKTRELSEKYGVTSAGDLLATVENIVKTQTAKGSAEALKNIAADKITKEMAMQNPEIKAYISELQKGNDMLNTKLTEQAAGFEREKVLGKVVKKGMQIWLSKNPILSQNESIKQKQIKQFEQTLKNGKYKLGEQGNLIVLDSEGRTLQNDFRDVSFENFVMSNNFFDLAPVDKNKRVPQNNPRGGESGLTHNFKDEDLTPKGYNLKKAELEKAGDKAGKAALYQAFLSKNYPDSNT